VDLELTAWAPPIGRTISEIPWLPSTLLLAIRRDGSVFHPDEQTILAEGDRLSLLVPATAADSVAEQISGPPAPEPT